MYYICVMKVIIREKYRFVDILNRIFPLFSRFLEVCVRIFFSALVFDNFEGNMATEIATHASGDSVSTNNSCS